VLAMAPTDPELSAALQSLSTSDCLRSGELRMSTELMRGALFRALYRRDFLRAAPAFAEAPYDFSKAVSDQTTLENQTYVILRRFASCAVRADPEDGRRLMLTAVASKAENEAFRGLTPHLGPCLPQGLEVKFSRMMIVNLVAEAMYRETKAGAAASSGGPNG